MWSKYGIQKSYLGLNIVCHVHPLLRNVFFDNAQYLKFKDGLSYIMLPFSVN